MTSRVGGLPLVSVITPSFNQGRWLRDNLGSVAAQDYPNVEHVVMDGGSDDESVALLKAASSTIRWRSEPDQGQADAINKAYRASLGEFIGWLNSDDAYFSKSAISEAVAFFDRNPGVDVLYGHAVLVNAGGLILQTIWVPKYDYRRLQLHDFICQPAAFIRRTALGDRMVDDSFHYTMDYELWLRLGRQNRNFARLDSILAIDRQHPGRKSMSIKSLGGHDRDRLIRDYGVGPAGVLSAIKRKGGKIGRRFAGLSLIARAGRASLAFDGSIDSVVLLAVRQAAVPRAYMPITD